MSSRWKSSLAQSCLDLDKGRGDRPRETRNPSISRASHVEIPAAALNLLDKSGDIALVKIGKERHICDQLPIAHVAMEDVPSKRAPGIEVRMMMRRSLIS